MAMAMAGYVGHRSSVNRLPERSPSKRSSTPVSPSRPTWGLSQGWGGPETTWNWTNMALRNGKHGVSKHVFFLGFKFWDNPNLNVSHVEGWAAKAGPTLESNAKGKEPPANKDFWQLHSSSMAEGIEKNISIFHPFSIFPPCRCGPKATSRAARKSAWSPGPSAEQEAVKHGMPYGQVLKSYVCHKHDILYW